MTTRAVEFLHVWVSENMTPFSHEEDNPEAKELARKCLAEASCGWRPCSLYCGGDQEAVDEAEPPYWKFNVRNAR